MHVSGFLCWPSDLCSSADPVKAIEFVLEVRPLSIRVFGDLLSACDAFRGSPLVMCRSLMLLGAKCSIEMIAPG